MHGAFDCVLIWVYEGLLLCLSQKKQVNRMFFLDIVHLLDIFILVCGCDLFWTRF